MIELHHVLKTYRIQNRRRVILRDINYRFEPGVSTGILGRNGTGKSTLIRIIGGKESPDRGRVLRTSRTSWPIGFSGCFHGQLTGRENLRFVCRIYGASFKKVTDFVDYFAELGPYLDMPVKTYSSGMAAKLAFGLSMALEFDFYLIDEVTSVGDASFRAKSREIFEARRADSTLIVVSHSISTIKAYCDRALVLDQGELLEFPGIDESFEYYNKICREQAVYHYEGSTSNEKALLT